MRREEAKGNKSNKSNQVYVEESGDKKSTDKTKASKEIQRNIRKCDEYKDVSVE